MDSKQRQEFLDDLDAFLMDEIISFNPSTIFDDVHLDEQGVAVVTLVDEKEKKEQHHHSEGGLFLQRKKKPLPSFGKGKDLETVLRALSAQNSPPPSSSSSTQNPHPPSSSCTQNPIKEKPNWNDEERMECSKRKLHQAYLEDQNKRRKIQLIDIKNLPVPKPQRRNCNKNKLPRSSKCRVF